MLPPNEMAARDRSLCNAADGGRIPTREARPDLGLGLLRRCVSCYEHP